MSAQGTNPELRPRLRQLMPGLFPTEIILPHSLLYSKSWKSIKIGKQGLDRAVNTGTYVLNSRRASPRIARPGPGGEAHWFLVDVSKERQGLTCHTALNAEYTLPSQAGGLPPLQIGKIMQSQEHEPIKRATFVTTWLMSCKGHRDSVVVVAWSLCASETGLSRTLKALYASMQANA